MLFRKKLLFSLIFIPFYVIQANPSYKGVVYSMINSCTLGKNLKTVINQTLLQYPSLDKTKFFDLLEKSLGDNLSYNREHSNSLLNCKALYHGSCFLVVGMGLGYLIWKIIGRDNAHYDRQFQEKISQLNAMGITVAEEQWGSSLHKIIIQRPIFISADTERVIDTVTPQLKNIRDKQYNSKKNFSIKEFCLGLGVLGACISLKISWDFFMRGIFPNYKEQVLHYESMLHELTRYRSLYN